MGDEDENTFSEQQEKKDTKKENSAWSKDF